MRQIISSTIGTYHRGVFSIGGTDDSDDLWSDWDDNPYHPTTLVLLAVGLPKHLQEYSELTIDSMVREGHVDRNGRFTCTKRGCNLHVGTAYDQCASHEDDRYPWIEHAHTCSLCTNPVREFGTLCQACLEDVESTFDPTLPSCFTQQPGVIRERRRNNRDARGPHRRQNAKAIPRQFC